MIRSIRAAAKGRTPLGRVLAKIQEEGCQKFDFNIPEHDELLAYHYKKRDIRPYSETTNAMFTNGHNAHVNVNFPNLRALILTSENYGCEKNFVYYNGNLSPHMEHLVIDGHPCEPCVLQAYDMASLQRKGRTNDKQPQIYLVNDFYDYYVTQKGWPLENDSNVHSFDKQELRDWIHGMTFDMPFLIEPQNFK